MSVGWLDSLPIETPDVLVPAYVVCGALVLLLVVPRLGMTPLRHRAAWSMLAAGVGALLGWLAVWTLVDADDAFGAPASDVIRGAATGAGAALGAAAVNLVRTRWWRKVVAVVAAGAALTAAGLIVNRDVAYYPKLGDVLGDDVAALDLHHPSALATPPTVGRVGTVHIPSPVSRFRARDAWVYLPSAALQPDPPLLPVVIALAGQPGGPEDVFQAGGLQAVLDRIAATHHGVAPIVVAADQLGAYNVNPMCVDSAMGAVHTYITVDVRDWILDHLPVTVARTGWTVAGFSEGATCAVQFGTEDPGLFGSFLAVSPELGPMNGTLARTLQDGFAGRIEAWRAAQPIAVMRAHGRYVDTTALYSVGSRDRRYGTAAPRLAAASRAVGMHVRFRRLAGFAHNWNTGAAGFADGLQRLLPVWGIR